MNFAGGAVTLIFTVERFNSAVHHRETHSLCLALSPASGTFELDALSVSRWGDDS